MSKPTLVRMWNTVYVGARGYLERRLPLLPWPWLERLQRHRVRAVVTYAFREVPFYRDEMRRAGLRPTDFRTAADLARLPLIDSSVLSRNPDAFLAAAYLRRRTFTVFSTGTARTGQKRIVWDERALLRQLVYGERDRSILYRLLGKGTGLRRLSLFPKESSTAEVTEFQRNCLYVPAALMRTKSLSPRASYEEIAEQIDELRPDVVYSYGSVAEGFFRYAAAHGISVVAPRVWVYGGDGLSAEGCSWIESHFRCLVYSTYQAVEAGRIGFQCEKREGFHINADLCPIRIVDPDGQDVPPGEVGEIVVSNLYNRAMVLLNVRTGDLGAMSSAPCSCGRSLPVLARFEGRTSSVLHLSNGREILDHVLTHAYKHALEDALAFQIVERRPGDFLWRVVPCPDADRRALERRILDAARSVLGPESSLAMEFVDDLERGPHGKFCRVVRTYEVNG